MVLVETPGRAFNLRSEPAAAPEWSIFRMSLSKHTFTQRLGTTIPLAKTVIPAPWTVLLHSSLAYPTSEVSHVTPERQSTTSEFPAGRRGGSMCGITAGSSEGFVRL